MLQDEIATLRLEIDTIEKQNQENKKTYFEDIGDLQKTIKWNGEILTTMISEYTAQLGVLTAENTMLHSQLESEKRKKESLETEVESYCCRLAAARRDCEQSETSKRDVEHLVQGARDEWFHLQEKMNFDMSDLKANNVLRSQQLSRTQSNLESLSLKFQHTRDALTEKQKRGLFQNVWEETYAKHSVKSRKFNKCIKINNVTEGIRWKAGTIRGEASQMQTENMLLPHELDDAYNKADNQEKTIINIQDQSRAAVKKLQAEKEKLEEKNQASINECNHFKERLQQQGNEKAERDVKYQER
ncbi:hypothetical protein H8958_022615 [Nasalis larvatus]